MVVDLRPTADEQYLLVGLNDEVTLKKTPEKINKKNVVEDVVGESESSLEFDT